MPENVLDSEVMTSDSSTAFNQVAEGVDDAPSTGILYRVLKRVFDVVFSVCVIVVGFIPGLLLSVAVAAETKGFPIYTQTRIGQYGRPFKLYKFRTMVADADDVEKYLDADQLETWKRERKVENDPRITSLGRILRKTSIDEFPQFINVLLGHMSVIGPRPITSDEIEWFGEDKDLYLSVPMGITGWWQVSLRNDVSFESGIRQELELHYVKNAGFAMDIKVFIATFGVMVKKTGR